MIVYYRLCSISSTNPSPILQEDKFELNKLCLKSFREAFRKVNPEVVILGDFCGEREEEMVRQILPFKVSFIPLSLGINKTCLMQYDMALKQTEHQEILFLECDYLWNDAVDVGQRVLEGIQELDLVSPYDHKNFYIDKSIHSDVCGIKLVGDQHWRTTERNTMTFGIKKSVFDQCYHTFKKYGYLDNDVWKDVFNLNHPLFVPIPSLATHCVANYMAPSVNWERIWKSL